MSARKTKSRKCPGPDLKPIARSVWGAAFPGEQWPKGWRVEWVGFMRGALGLTLWSSRRILLSYSDAKNPKPEFNRTFDGHGSPTDFWTAPNCPLETLVHEFIHVRWPSLRHGRDFDRLTNGALARVWEAVR